MAGANEPVASGKSPHYTRKRASQDQIERETEARAVRQHRRRAPSVESDDEGDMKFYGGASPDQFEVIHDDAPLSAASPSLASGLSSTPRQATLARGVSTQPQRATLTRGSSGGEVSGCTHPECKSLPLSIRKQHRRDNASVGRHIGCCLGAPGCEQSRNGHDVTCTITRVAELRSLGTTPFNTQNPILPWLVTVTANGRSIPCGGQDGTQSDWLHVLYRYFERMEATHRVFGNIDLIEECNGRERHKHIHGVVFMAVKEEDKNKVQKLIRIELGIGKEDHGLIPGKAQLKLCRSADGAVLYLSKGAQSGAFRFVGNNGKTLQDWKDLEKHYRSKESGDGIGQHGAVVKRSELLHFVRKQQDLYSGRCLDLTVWDWLLRLLQSREARLADGWSIPSGNYPVDLEKVSRHQKIMWAPHTTTERDVFVLAVGSTDSRGNRHKNYVFDQVEHIVHDTELVAGPMFNEKYRGLSLTECLETWDDQCQQNARDDVEPVVHPPCIPAPVMAPAITDRALWDWQLCIATILRTPESPIFSRSIIWLWEQQGGYGKSVFANYLLRRTQSFICSSARKMDIHYALVQWITDSKKNPAIVVFDLSRNEKEVPWEAIEEIKNGCITSSKYESGIRHFDRPHVVVLSNRKPEGVGDKVSADRIIEVELRQFSTNLESGLIPPPTTTAELRRFPSVVLYQDVERVADSDAENDENDAEAGLI